MAMGSLVIYICESYACGQTWKGWLLSAHAFGYCTTQIIGGQIADRIGGHLVVAASLLGAGASLAMTPMAASAMGLSGIALTQVTMGIATGPLFPASTQLLVQKLPASDRAMASTTLDTGITVGSLIVVPLSGFLAVRFGWEYTLVIYGLLAVGYSLVWLRCIQHPSGEKSSCDNGAKTSSGSAGDSGMAAVLVGVRHSRLWAIYVAHFTFNYGIYFINSWSATYYLEVFSLRPEQAGLHLSLPHAVNLLVKVLINPALEHFLRERGATNIGRRRVFSGLGFIVSALFMAMVPFVGRYVSGPYPVTVCMSMALGFAALHPSGFKANYMDVTKTHSGVVSGIGNTIASFASSIGPVAVAQMRASTGSWAPAFGSVAVLNVLAMIVFSTLSSATPIEEEEAAVAKASPTNDTSKKTEATTAPSTDTSKKTEASTARKRASTPEGRRVSEAQNDDRKSK